MLLLLLLVVVAWQRAAVCDHELYPVQSSLHLIHDDIAIRPSRAALAVSQQRLQHNTIQTAFSSAEKVTSADKNPKLFIFSHTLNNVMQQNCQSASTFLYHTIKKNVFFKKIYMPVSQLNNKM